MSELYVVGIGPGAYEQMTIQAAKVLEKCDVIVGYTAYIDLVKDHYSEKQFLSTPMKKEIDRCEMAFKEAAKGQAVAMICSGDAGIYGMAAPVLELQADYKEVRVQVIPGVSAVSSGAAVLGAPVNHDFAVISLSDLLTPWEKIEKRLLAAAEADFVVCLYNPSSRKRHDYLERACRLMGQYKSGETVCGIVRNIGREGELMTLVTLKELESTSVDMFTTVFIGNSQTKNLDDRMVTPRGYRYE